MTINYQFGDVDAHGAMIRAQAGLLEAEHQAIVRDVLAAGDFWGGAGSVACQEFITQLGLTGSTNPRKKPRSTATRASVRVSPCAGAWLRTARRRPRTRRRVNFPARSTNRRTTWGSIHPTRLWCLR
ncbi:putative esat-6 like protein [Mycobacterium tuberculosis]|nr:putative esat-6 like protein [Mycobacterium tuberculosis]